MRILLLAALCLALCPVVVAQSIDEPTVKKSDSGICHERESSSYKRTKHFESFDTAAACLASGGRLPANANSETDSSASKAEHKNLYWLSSAMGKGALIALILLVVGGTYWLSRGRTRTSQSANLQDFERKKWEGHRLDTKGK
jgi:hypothetical protein